VSSAASRKNQVAPVTGASAADTFDFQRVNDGARGPDIRRFWTQIIGSYYSDVLLT